MQRKKCSLLSHVQLFETPLTANCQGLLSMEFSRQAYWSGLPFPSPGDFPKPGIKLRSSSFFFLQTQIFYITGNFFTVWATRVKSKSIQWKWKLLSQVQLFATPWTTQSMEFSRSEHWSGQPFPSPGDIPNPGIEPRSPALQADSLPDEPQGKPQKYTGPCLKMSVLLSPGLST